MSADHAYVGLFGISVFKTIASQSHFSCRQVVFRLKPGPLLRRFPRKNVVFLQSRKRF
jgi:hypothetical protein